MAIKKVQLYDNLGVPIYPKTVGSEVYQTDAQGNLTNNLWAEPGAQVNKIESITVNGQATTIDANRNVDINVAGQNTQYTMVKLVSPDAGYLATYQLYKLGTGSDPDTAVGDKINIPIVEEGAQAIEQIVEDGVSQIVDKVDTINGTITSARIIEYVLPSDIDRVFDNGNENNTTITNY